MKLNFSKILFFIVIFLISLKPIMDPDLGWHLRLGESILTEFQIPRLDSYSFSLPGHPMVLHTWLQDTLLSISYKTFGMTGLSLWFSLWIILTGFVLLKPKKINWKFLIGSLLLGFAVEFIGLRPHVVTLFGLSLIYFFLDNFNSLKISQKTSLKEFLIKSKSPFLIGFFLLWANMHAGVLVGLLFLTFGLLLVFGLKLFNRKFKSKLFLYCFLVLSFCFFVTLINPYGLDLYRFTFNLATNEKTLATNQDWLPLLSSRFPQDTLIPRILLVVFSIYGIMTAAKNYQKFLLIIVFLLTLISVRFSLVLFIVLIPDLSINFSSYLKSIFGKANYLKILPLLILVLVTQIDNFNKWQCSLNIDCYQNLANVPSELINHLSMLENEARVLNEYSLGGYLVWQVPEKKVFIDGRMDGFKYKDENFIEIYRHLYEADSNYLNLLNEFQIDYLLLPKNSPVYMELSRSNQIENLKIEEEFVLAKILKQ